jgi:hypothetical protein
MKERSWNVYENKGSVIHSSMESGNVVENKYSYALKAGMLLKTQHVSRKSPFHSAWRDVPSRFRRPCASGSRIELRRTRAIMTAREVMSLAPLGHEAVVWTIGVTKGVIQGGARARKSGSFRCRTVAASL